MNERTKFSLPVCTLNSKRFGNGRLALRLNSINPELCSREA